MQYFPGFENFMKIFWVLYEGRGQEKNNVGFSAAKWVFWEG